MTLASSSDVVQLFSCNYLLGMLAPNELQALLAHATVRRFSAGQRVFGKGEPGCTMMAVLAGRVKICSPSLEGKEVVLRVVNPGEIFGEVAILDGQERLADAVAMGNTQLVVIDRRHIIPVLRAHPDMSLRLMTVLCDRLRRTTAQVEDAIFLDAPARLAKQLLALARLYGVATPDGLRIELKLSQSQIGSMVGTSRESINKQLRDWTKDGIIRVEDGLITIRRGAFLQGLADPLPP